VDEWSSQVPGVEATGQVSLFDDERIRWLQSCFRQGLKGARVLELGPLEGGHTAMLEQAGAKVTAIEANHASFLKCLIVKNFLGLKANFLLGDFSKLGPGLDDGYDLIVASGVLYHSTGPTDLLASLQLKSDHLFLWTHYFEEDPSKWHPALQGDLSKRFGIDSPQSVDVGGVSYALFEQRYGDALGWGGFCGGPEQTSLWMTREGILGLLRSFGYSKIRISFDEPGHVGGPAFCVYASRSGVRVWLNELFGRLKG